MIPLPEPPLRATLPPLEPAGGARDIVLRAWRADDAAALVAAWDDPEIQRWTAVPERRDTAAAERWIDGADARRERWLSLDLVVALAGEVVGEVGLSSFDRGARTAEAGWWTAASARGRGIASAAAGLLVAWARRELGLTAVVARCDPANPASRVVAERAGAMVLL